MSSWNNLQLLTLEDMARPRPVTPQTLVLLGHAALARRRDNMAALFIPAEHIPSFWAMMKATKSVVSGSTALLFWLGLEAFKPNDLDVFTTASHVNSVCDWFKDVLGCEHVSETEEKYKEGGTFVSGVEKVVRVKNKGQFVDITVSRGSSALLPLANFWSTALQNFVTADGAYCAYPAQLWTTRGFIPALPQYKDPNATTHLVKKYKHRGVDNVYKFTEWTGIEGNGCVDRWTCPAEWRKFGDEGGAVCWFQRGYSMVQNRDLMMCEIPVVWRLGGGECRSVDFGAGFEPSCANVNGVLEPKTFELSEALRHEAKEWQNLGGDYELGLLQNGSLDQFLA